MYRGRDISAVFRKEGPSSHLHSKGAAALLERCCIGVLNDGNDAGTEAACLLHEPVDESKPLLPQLVKLEASEYMRWVDVPSTGHPIVFANTVVERLTCTHWFVVPLLWLPVAAAFMWRAVARGGLPLLHVPGFLIGGVLAWQLLEYSIHRFLFHFHPKGPQGIKLHFMLHGRASCRPLRMPLHHKYPMDFDRLVFPPVPASFVVAVLYALLHAVAPMGCASALLGGIVAGYVSYDTTHWALHTGAPFPLVNARLKSSHMAHHYLDDSVSYGISSTLYDVLFGTLHSGLRHQRQRAARGAAGKAE
eukprot:scaffold2.g6781.t1